MTNPFDLNAMFGQVFTQAAEQHEAEHKHVGEFKRTIEAEATLAEQAGTCKGCISDAVLDFYMDRMLELRMGSDPVKFVLVCEEISKEMTAILMKRLVLKLVEDRAKVLAGTMAKA